MWIHPKSPNWRLSCVRLRFATNETKPVFRRISIRRGRGGGEARTDNVEAEGDEAMVLGEGEGRREERSLESEDMFEVINQAFAV